MVGRLIARPAGAATVGTSGAVARSIDLPSPALICCPVSCALAGGATAALYYAVGVFSEVAGGVRNGIPVFAEPWKNVVATFYHELNEARTDADVEDAILAGNDPNAVAFLGWTSQQGEECGDFPVFEANPLSEVFQEVLLTDGSATVAVQFQYSNAVAGPEGPTPNPEVLSQAAGKG